jgi:hypothetical protein
LSAVFGALLAVEGAPPVRQLQNEVRQSLALVRAGDGAPEELRKLALKECS